MQHADASHLCNFDACGLEKCQRARKFQLVLDALSRASLIVADEDSFFTCISTIVEIEELLTPLDLIPNNRFHPDKYKVDIISQKYLENASKSVQHLIPIATLGNGNCLFHSIALLLQDYHISTVELRVRTLAELVRNRRHYQSELSKLIGPIKEAIQRACNNYSFAELYELAALANVLHCEIQSVYPYIDYRAEMKCMNKTYVPCRMEVPINGRVIIFWTSTEDEDSTRSRSGDNGVCNPNHFVPLLMPSVDNSTTPTKETRKNNQQISIRSPEFSPPPNIRRHQSISITQSHEQALMMHETNSNSEQRSDLMMRNSGLNITEQQEKSRRASVRVRKQRERLLENVEQRQARLDKQKQRTAVKRSKKKHDQKDSNINNKRDSQDDADPTKQQENTINKPKKTNEYRSERVLNKEQQELIDSYVWPSAIPTKLKEYCLQDFCNHTSMKALQQLTCGICNSQTGFDTIKEYSIDEIPNRQQIAYHQDVEQLIIKSHENPQSDRPQSSFLSESKTLLFKNGFDQISKKVKICHLCHSALIKNKVPIFSPANKAWIGDIPSVLRRLTIAEEKLIALYRHNSCIIKLQSPFHHHSTAQSALKGNVITFMHNVPNIVKTLPLAVEDLCDTLKIVFVGAHPPNRLHLRKICGVNRENVRNALIWLRNNNYMYHTIPIDEKNLAQLPENDVPECIWATMENAEYSHEAEAERSGFSSDPLTDAVDRGEANQSNALAISSSAVVDVNGTTIASEDIDVHVLEKVKKDSLMLPMGVVEESIEDSETVYMIPRSHLPINDCSNPELLLGLFPTLFPYGCGAPQDPTRPIPTSLNQHIRYLLSYDDRRFESHHSFMFVLFNVMQRRQACWNASLMVSRPYFQSKALELQTLTSKEIEAALTASSSAKKSSFSSATSRINTLLGGIRIVSGNVMGSAQSRAVLRTQIHALIFNQGLPSIFITINPADIHSSIAIYFAGVDLDLDRVLPEKIPSTYERAQIVAAHPVATARFFNVLISSILKYMIERGVLGPIKAYFGTVENQGRGSLHLHMLLWLRHNYTPSQLKELVKHEEFRQGLIDYLEDIIKQDLSAFDCSSSEKHDPTPVLDVTENEALVSLDGFEQSQNQTKHLTPGIMPTPQPWKPNFLSNFKKDTVQLVNSNNIHKHTATCYKYSRRHGNQTCRMRMPRRIEYASSVDIESGEIKLKRLHQTINNFNEYIISACRSNMDIKYIFSGSDAKALVYYITDYVTKSNLSLHDTFSLVLKATQSFEKHTLSINSTDSAEERSRKLILRCYNTLASQQELSGVQVASYLMGWPDHYTSHEFVNIFLVGIENYLQATLTEAHSSQRNRITSKFHHHAQLYA